MAVTVSVAQGDLRGDRVGHVTVFRGVPYAEPPVGALRLRAPEPRSPWSGVRDASVFGDVQPQHGRPSLGFDWLTLSVWTSDPERSGKPVFVWISGGGYLNCAADNVHFDGSTLAQAGVVVVSVQYRVGFEGFGFVDGAPSNRGLLDQVQALRWVQENVSSFGGDPENVTLVGQSAGAGCVAALLGIVEARGLFRRAAIQSLPATYFSADLARDVTREIAGTLQCEPTLPALAKVDPQKIVDATAATVDALVGFYPRWGLVAYGATPFSPVVDGATILDTPWSDVGSHGWDGFELLIGHTKDEYSLFAAQAGWNSAKAMARLGSQAASLPNLHLYGEAHSVHASVGLECIVLSDWLFRMPTLRFAERLAAGGARVWLYELTWGFSSAGASHGLDTLLLFGTAHIGTGLVEAGPEAVSDARRLGVRIRRDYIAFCEGGDPGWARFESQRCLTQIYSSTPVVTPYPEEASRGIWGTQEFGACSLPRLA